MRGLTGNFKLNTHRRALFFCNARLGSTLQPVSFSKRLHLTPIRLLSKASGKVVSLGKVRVLEPTLKKNFFETRGPTSIDVVDPNTLYRYLDPDPGYVINFNFEGKKNLVIIFKETIEELF